MYSESFHFLVGFVVIFFSFRAEQDLILYTHWVFIFLSPIDEQLRWFLAVVNIASTSMVRYGMHWVDAQERNSWFMWQFGFAGIVVAIFLFVFEEPPKLFLS